MLMTIVYITIDMVEKTKKYLINICTFLINKLFFIYTTCIKVRYAIDMSVPIATPINPNFVANVIEITKFRIDSI